MNTNQLYEGNTFWRFYYNGEYHCDPRITIRNCAESEAFIYMNYICIALSAVAFLAAFGLVYWRVVYRHQKFFEMHGKVPRPRPIESMGLFGILFNLCRMIQCIILVTDVAPWPVFRLILWDLVWQFGISVFSCYFFGVSQTLALSNKVIYNAWVRSEKAIDIFCLITIALPFTLPTIFNIMSGYYATIGDIDNANIYFQVDYYIWGILPFLIGIYILLAGIRLVTLIGEHLLSQSDRRNIAKLKAGAFKVKLTITFGCLTLFFLSSVSFIYAAGHYTVMNDTKFSIALLACMYFAGPVTTIVKVLVVLLNPNIIETVSNWSFSSSDDNKCKGSNIIISQLDESYIDSKHNYQISVTKPSEDTITSNDDFLKSTSPRLKSKEKSSNSPSLQSFSETATINHTQQQQRKYSFDSLPPQPTSPISMNNYLKKYSIVYETNRTSYEQQHTPHDVDQIEVDHMHYNYTTGDIRLPAHYISPDVRKQQQLQEEERRHTMDENRNHPFTRKLSFKK
ncbi:hypothetical protein BJ944DRAFT_266891 [Cunninghamella echinulata]|nr:hypothetical protein BJ944DRAFT_266891 [Cunninghamella echinulata]